MLTGRNVCQELDKMIQSYKIVTLCESTRFKEQFLAVQKRLTLEGYIVIKVGGYIGVGTRREIAYAEKTGKTIKCA